MKNQTETLQIGSPALAFTLASANRESTFSLSDLISRGPLVIEFLRGTW
jgi:peroxiredoxin